MSNLTYSHTLIAGTPEDVNDVQDMFNDVRALVNGNLDSTNLATSAKPVTLLGAYQTVSEHNAVINSNMGVLFSTWYIASTTYNWHGSTSSGSNVPAYGIPINTTEWNISGLTPKLRITAVVAFNATAPAANFTFGLYPFTVAGGSGQINVTLGTVVSGSTIAINTPAASTVTTGTGSDFTVPATGIYTLGVANSAAVATNSVGECTVRLMVHWV